MHQPHKMIEATLPDERFDGRQLIVVSNREPCVHEFGPNGEIVARHSVGGVASALDPVMRAMGGTWIAHASGGADRDTADARGHITVGDRRGYTLRRVWLTPREERGHYDGLSNTGLWPLCHLAFEAPRFRSDDWRQYQKVNCRFADAVAAEARDEEPIVFVQDYHFALLPRLLRDRLPRATIAAFWHIPWPTHSRFERCPYADDLVAGLLGSDIVGFQTEEYAERFVDCVRHQPGASADRGGSQVWYRQSVTAVGAFPISVEWPSRFLATQPSAAECRRLVRVQFGLPADARVVLAVDRCDYTKGIEQRLEAVGRLLARRAVGASGPVLVQVAAPTRTRLTVYRDLAARVRAQAAAINERFGRPGYQPVVLIERHMEPDEVFRLYRAADICHVNSLDDGMNLVAKEFVAARDDERGVLVLSRFTGAARQLVEALFVNPCDVDGSVDVLAQALSMADAEQAKRMRALRRAVRRSDVLRWAGDILTATVSMRPQSPEIATVFPG